jgi:hypothetical protein
VEVVAMKKRDAFTRGLAIAGTVLAWFPIAAALLTSRLFGPHPRIDYLIPAELFPLVVVLRVVVDENFLLRVVGYVSRLVKKRKPKMVVGLEPQA